MKKIFTLLLIVCSLSSFAQSSLRCYKDLDNDGYGDPNNPVASIPNQGCPFQTVQDNTDCDDHDASVHMWVWFRDRDHDGYHDGTTIESCTQPDGYIDNPISSVLDCNDTNADIHPIKWYYDHDHDGYAAGEEFYILSCTQPDADRSLPEYLLKGWDECSDNDANIYPRVYYTDADGDGYRSPADPITVCVELDESKLYLASEFNTLDIDCDDENVLIGPGHEWYKDQDNDGYTDGTILRACVQPEGYIDSPKRTADAPFLLKIDCNDSDPLEHPDRFWFLDNDGDHHGQGLGGEIRLSCTRPAGNWFASSELISTNDCDDGNIAITNTAIWCLDADKDGYYTGDPVTQCASPGPGYVIKIAQKPGDCNDNEETINPETIWYIDKDNDGYHRGLPYAPSCTSPGPSFTLLNTKGLDCNDDDPTINTESVWYLDADDDGYHDPIYLASISCTSPGPNFKNSTKGVDCNDANKLHNPETIWILDKDGDGYYVDERLGCFIIEGYKIKTDQQEGDCNDDDPAIHLQTVWYLDADNDGYHDPIYLASISCTSPGPNFKNSTKGVDCNDANKLHNPETIWILDKDADGYYIDEQLGCFIIEGYQIKSNQQQGDCNDDDPGVHTSIQYYVDVDKDGYGSVTTAMLCSSVAPVGYSINNTDCNDGDPAVHPFQYYVDGDKDGYGSATTAMLCSSVAPVGYSTNNTDCNDGDAAINPETIWYKDSDGDGYSDVLYISLPSCTSPGGSQFKLTIKGGGDCNDGDASINPETVWYLDADNDGYYTGSGIITCQPFLVGYKKSGLLGGGDCDDNDQAINPASVEVCGNNKDDNCNNVQNEQNCYACGNATNFSTTSITSNSATLNWVSIPNPNLWQIQYKSTKPGTKWIDVKPDITGDKRLVQITGLSAKVKYQWHIKARCGTGWTAYSVSVLFTTLASGITQKRSAETPETTVASATETFDMQVSPNPSQQSFRIVIGASNLNEPVKLIVTDILGRVVETKTTHTGQIITIGENYRSGLYLIQAMLGKEQKQLKLIKL